VSARREAFDEYCRDAARAQRAAKAEALKEESKRASLAEGDKDKEAYARLLREEVTSTRTTWHEFRRKWKKDRRFFGWATEKARERAFRDWVRDLADGETRLPIEVRCQA
jgi:FF domain